MSTRRFFFRFAHQNEGGTWNAHVALFFNTLTINPRTRYATAEAAEVAARAMLERALTEDHQWGTLTRSTRPDAVVVWEGSSQHGARPVRTILAAAEVAS
jgi:hypothetical protein